MRCDVVAIGTELLLGQIVDTNSSWLGEQLSAAGIDSCLQVKVGDNLGRMVKAIRSTLDDADAVIICGGLGPTHDDITRQAIAEIMGVELEFNDEVGMVISEMFASRNRRMPEINMRQAMVPKGASIVEQRRGTAPGLVCPVGDKVIYAVPGVPYELYEMFERGILPDLLKRSGSASVISSRTSIGRNTTAAYPREIWRSSVRRTAPGRASPSSPTGRCSPRPSSTTTSSPSARRRAKPS